MLSTDREILLEINGRLSRIELRLDGLENRVSSLEARTSRLEQQTSAVMIELAEQHGRLDALQNGLNIWCTVICAVIAFVGIFAPKFWESFSRKEAKPEQNIDIDEVAHRAVEILERRYILTPKR